MCRLWGISYGPGGPEAEDWTPSELAQIMFPSLVHQGPHAYGWMTWDGVEIEMVKYEGRCDTHEALATMDLNPHAKWVVGHTRYATHGDPADMRNNHPIEHGDFIGVHNGVLRNHEAILKETGRQDPATEVDSEAIFAAINKWGHRAGLRRVEGDMVTIYVDVRKPHVLHLARSRGRSLYYARTKAGSLIWASEIQAIEATGLQIVGGFSEVGSNRLLRAKEGRIVERITFRTVDPKRYDSLDRMFSGGLIRTPTPNGHPVRGITDRMDKPAQVGAAGAPEKGVKPLSKGKKRRARTPNSKLHHAHSNGSVPVTCKDGKKLIYYRGVLMSENEYQDLLMDEARMGTSW